MGGDASPSGASVRPDPPPLRIHHLFVCGFVTALMMSLLRLLLSYSRQEQSLAGTSVFAFTQVITSIGLTLTGFSIYWWRKGYASFSQPGQMLLIQYAATLILYFVSLAFMVVMNAANGNPQSLGWFSMLSVIMGLGSFVFGVLLPIIFYVWCAWKIADTWAWRTLFVLCALAALLTSTFAIMLMQFVVGYNANNFQIIFAVPHLIRGTMLLAIGAVALATDLAARRERSWTHWAGIILWLLGQVGTLLMGLYYMFIWQMV